MSQQPTNQQNRPNPQQAQQQQRHQQQGRAQQGRNQQAQQHSQKNHVVVTDVDISFGNMVMLLIKLAFASIPAAILIGFVALFGFLVMSVLGGGAMLAAG